MAVVCQTGVWHYSAVQSCLTGNNTTQTPDQADNPAPPVLPPAGLQQLQMRPSTRTCCSGCGATSFSVLAAVPGSKGLLQGTDGRTDGSVAFLGPALRGWALNQETLRALHPQDDKVGIHGGAHGVGHADLVAPHADTGDGRDLHTNTHHKACQHHRD